MGGMTEDTFSSMLAKAMNVAGGLEELARHLRVPKKQLASWISGELDTPYGVFLRAVDFLRSRPT